MLGPDELDRARVELVRGVELHQGRALRVGHRVPAGGAPETEPADAHPEQHGDDRREHENRNAQAAPGGLAGGRGRVVQSGVRGLRVALVGRDALRRDGLGFRDGVDQCGSGDRRLHPGRRLHGGRSHGALRFGSRRRGRHRSGCGTGIQLPQLGELRLVQSPARGEGQALQLTSS